MVRSLPIIASLLFAGDGIGLCCCCAFHINGVRSTKPFKQPATESPIEQTIEMDKLYDAVIIGSGFSGLRAGQILSDYGSSVLVLEANDYIGGRAKTINLDATPGVPTDLGCEWLYKDNGMESFLADRGLLGAATGNDESNYSFEGTVQLYSQTEDGTTVEIPIDKVTAIWSEFMDFKKKLLKDFGDMSYSDVVRRFIQEEGINKEGIQYLNLVLDAGENEFSGDADFLSASEASFFFVEELEATHYMAVPGVGFGTVAASVANDMGANIKLNCKVFGIDYENSDVIISYEENGITKEVIARTALVTVSLGVLKAGTISFVPKLPECKRDAIDNMGFGLLNKCVMYWNSDDDIVWPDSFWFGLSTPADGTAGVFSHFSNPTKVKGVPSLTGWIAGKKALVMEEKSDAVTLDLVMANLRRSFPSIRDPDTVVITRWAQDENFRGSYSFNTVGRNFLDDAANLKERVGNVWWAGEATNLDEWHATTIGAWDTGEEAARDMLDSILKK